MEGTISLRWKKRETFFLIVFFLAEAVLLVFIFSFFPWKVLAGVGEDNVTIDSLLTVGNSAPEIVNLTINGGNPVSLSPNATVKVIIYAIVQDFNGENDIVNATSEFFDLSASSFGGADDKNDHYTNNSCLIDFSYGDSNEANVTCSYELEYYANNATWNGTLLVSDNSSFDDFLSGVETVNTLLAFGLPDSIGYGTVNETRVSDEQAVNITNFGNVAANLSLSGYARTLGDGYAMNCTLGSVQNISIGYEKYNLTSSHLGEMNFTEFDSNYTNLTSESVIKGLNLNYRTNDSEIYDRVTNTTYWRIYVPIGVAGSCSGNIIFGAIQSAAG